MCVYLIGRCLIECRDEYKYNVEAVELLIRNHLVNMQQYDLHLAQVLLLTESVAKAHRCETCWPAQGAFGLVSD